MVIFRISKFTSIMCIGSNKNGFGKFKEKFGGKPYLFFCTFQKIEVVVDTTIGLNLNV